MRIWMSVSLMALVVAAVAFAQAAKLRRIPPSFAGMDWGAVGRLDIGGAGVCTGALIAPDLVLTAAHCLFDASTGQRVKHGTITFLAGWKAGQPSISRAINRAVIHPDHAHHNTVRTGHLRNDLALLELQKPIRRHVVVPFDTAARPRKGDAVGVVSFARAGPIGPSLHDMCEVLAQQNGVLVTTCDVDFGSSGAPIFIFQKGRAHVVSVISAKAEADGQVVALGTALSAPLEVLKARLVAGEGYWSEEIGTAPDLTVKKIQTLSGAQEVSQ